MRSTGFVARVFPSSNPERPVFPRILAAACAAVLLGAAPASAAERTAASLPVVPSKGTTPA